MKSRFMKGVGLVLALALMLTNVAPLTAYAATKDAASLKKGDKLKPGDVLTYNGYINIWVDGADWFNTVLIDSEKNAITILESYYASTKPGKHITNLKVVKVDGLDLSGSKFDAKYINDNSYVDIYVAGSWVKKSCSHEYAPMPRLYDHGMKCTLCAYDILCDEPLVDGVCHKCGYGIVTKAPVAEPAVPEVATPTAPVVDTTSFSPVFNSTYYADANPDLKAVFGNDEALLLNHFLTCGMAEGRLASAEFNVHVYKANNADLRAVFGEDLASYYHHYINNGKAEGRVAK